MLLKNTDLFDNIEKEIKSFDTGLDDDKSCPYINITRYRLNGYDHNNGCFYINENGYYKIEIDTETEEYKTRRNAFTLAHEFGHCISQKRGIRSQDLANKGCDDKYVLNLRECIGLIKEEVGAWKLGYYEVRKYFSNINRILYFIRSCISVSTCFPVYVERGKFLSKCFSFLINKPVNWVFLKTDM